MSETTIEAWVLLPTAQECVLAGADTAKNAAVAAWLREDREGGWEHSARKALEKIHADPAKLAMAIRIGRPATAREVGCLLRSAAASAILENLHSGAKRR